LRKCKAPAPLIYSRHNFANVSAANIERLASMLVGVRVMLCTACGGELILTKVVPDETVAVPRVEQHTFVCSKCHLTERKVVFTKHGREDDSQPMPMPMSMQAAHIKHLAAMQEVDSAAQNLLGRVIARIRGQWF
jgi:hypothetical protein